MDRRKFLWNSVGFSLATYIEHAHGWAFGQGLRGASIAQPKPRESCQNSCVNPSSTDEFLIHLRGFMFMEFRQDTQNLVITCPKIANHTYYLGPERKCDARKPTPGKPIAGEKDWTKYFASGSATEFPQCILQFSRAQTNVGNLNVTNPDLRIRLPFPDAICMSKGISGKQLLSKGDSRVGLDVKRSIGDNDFAIKVTLKYKSQTTKPDFPNGSCIYPITTDSHTSCEEFRKHLNNVFGDCAQYFDGPQKFDLEFDQIPCDLLPALPVPTVCMVLGLNS